MTAVEVVIIGAGPAGLAAAQRLGQSGVATLIVDEYPQAGGRLLGQLYRRRDSWWDGRAQAEKLVSAVGQHASVHWCLQTSVIGLSRNEQGWQIFLSRGGSVEGVAAVLIATGAAEVSIPVSGWTLPGVMTVGAAQVMANVYRVRPGHRGIIVGLGPLAFAVAQELAWARVAVTGLVMPAPGLAAPLTLMPDSQWRSIAALSHLAPWWLRPLAPLLNVDRLRARFMAHAPLAGIPVAGTRLKPNLAVVEIVGNGRVEGVRLQRLSRAGTLIGEGWVEPVDFVLLSGGLRPIPDLLHAVGARVWRSGDGLYDVPFYGPLGETTQPGVFAAGNVLGVEAAPVAMAQGRSAALGLLRYLGRQGDDWADEVSKSRRDLQRRRREAPLVFSPEWSRIAGEMAVHWQQLKGGH